MFVTLTLIVPDTALGTADGVAACLSQVLVEEMRRDIIEVEWLLFPEDARAVEKKLRARPAIWSANVNPVNGLGVVVYDETQVSIADILRIVAQCGYHCRGVVGPRYLVEERPE